MFFKHALLLGKNFLSSTISLFLFSEKKVLILFFKYDTLKLLRTEVLR